MRTKKTRRDLNRLRAQAAAPLEFVAWPAWFIGGEVDLLLPVEDIDLSTITQAIYREAIEEAVEAGELRKDSLEAAWQERSWARFIAWREGDHGPHIDAAKHHAPTPPPSTVPAAEVYSNEPGVHYRERGLEPRREVEDRYQAEQDRLLRIANSVEPRWF